MSHPLSRFAVLRHKFKCLLTDEMIIFCPTMFCETTITYSDLCLYISKV